MVAAIVLSPTSGAYSTVVTVTGAGYTGGGAATITVFTIGTASPTTTPSTVTVANDGSWTATFIVPATIKVGAETVTATDSGAASATAVFTITQPTNVSVTYTGKITTGTDGGAEYTFVPLVGKMVGGVETFKQNQIGHLTGVTTSTSSTVLTDTSLTAPTNWLVNAFLTYTSGPAAGQSLIISANTATTITTGAFSPIPTALGGDSYRIDGDSNVVNTNIPPNQISKNIGTLTLAVEDSQPLWTTWTS
jgi:hypothetical protein